MVKVTKLAGKGVPGLEGDPPLYHFDATPEEMAQLLADPHRFLKEAGLPTSAAGRISLCKWAEAYSPEHGWQKRADGGSDTAVRPKSCCYVSGDTEITCHMHAPPQ